MTAGRFPWRVSQRGRGDFATISDADGDLVATVANEVLAAVIIKAVHGARPEQSEEVPATSDVQFSILSQEELELTATATLAVIAASPPDSPRRIKAVAILQKLKKAAIAAGMTCSWPDP
jgi:hypothetical protein